LHWMPEYRVLFGIQTIRSGIPFDGPAAACPSRGPEVILTTLLSMRLSGAKRWDDPADRIRACLPLSFRFLGVSF
jgi:hypothetical protein